MQRAVIYLRVSTHGQIDGYGLQNQHDDCQRYATRAELDVGAVHRDEGLSGTLPAHERPGLMDALSLLRDDHADVLLIPRLDRLARALTTQEVILAECWKLGRHVHAADTGPVPQDDPDDPMRTAMRQMAGVFAQLDRAMTVKRLRDGRRAKARAGGKPSGSYPFGWSKDGPLPDEQATLRRITTLRAAGHPWHEVATRLNDDGLLPRTARCWTAANVAKVAGPAQERVQVLH